MKYKKYTRSLTLFVEPNMFDLLEDIGKNERLSTSEILRKFVYDHIEEDYGEKYKMRE